MKALLFLLVFVRVASAQELLSEEWNAMMLNGQKAGYSYSARIKTKEDGKVVIESVEKQRLSLKRMGVPLEVEGDGHYFELEDGTPLRFNSRMKQSETPTITEGVITNGKLKLRTVSGGVETLTESDWDPECLLTEGARLLTLKKGFAEGTKYTFKSFSSDMGKVGISSVEILGKDTREILGQKREFVKATLVSSLQPAIKITGWTDDKGSVWYSEANMGGLKIGTERTTKEEALKEAKAEMPEAFLTSMPKSNVSLPRPRKITSLTVRLERPDTGFKEWKPPTSTQEVLERDEKSVTLRITSGAPDKPAVLPMKAEGDLAKFLLPSPSVQCTDEDILKKAKELVGDETDSLKAAQKLAGWVYKHISKKSMDVAAGSAKEVFVSKKGDCTEHSVLLTAMLRAAGIPAKVSTGYLYVAGSWGGHAWTSAWVGKWIDLDGTLGGDVADAARIKFGETALDEIGAMMEGTSGAGFLHGSMKIDAKEYVIDGRKVSVGQSTEIQGNLFTAGQLGFSFEKPEKWSFKTGKDLPPMKLGILASGDSEITLTYMDLPAEAVESKTATLAKKLGAGKGKSIEIAGCEAYDGKSALVIRLNQNELLQIELKGDAANEAADVIKATFKLLKKE